MQWYSRGVRWTDGRRGDGTGYAKAHVAAYTFVDPAVSGVIPMVPEGYNSSMAPAT